MNLVYGTMTSKVGELLLVAEVAETGLSVRGIYFANKPHAKIPEGAREDTAALAPLRRQIEEYLAGDRRSFAMTLAPIGTPFQREVWRTLETIPYGETKTYAEIAKAIGKPRAVRAVGAANARNPIALVVPCHRVIGADGTLTGYAGGLENKRALLDLEGCMRV